MYDYIKLNISYLSKLKLLANSFLNWHQDISLETSELKYPIIGNYHNIRIIINKKSITLDGSIHVLYNIIKTGTKQNYNDLNFENAKEMIYHLRDVLELDLEKTIIQNLEIGLNIETMRNPTDILRRNLIVWNFKTPTRNKKYKGKGKSINYETSQYVFKLYDKGIQYKTGTNIMRIEAKIIRNERLNKYGVTNLKDLTTEAKTKALLNYLYDTYSKTVIIDENPLQAIKNTKEKDVIQNGINPLYWQNIACRKTRQRFKTKFFYLIEKYKLDQIYNEIDIKLKSKGNELLKCHEMNTFEIGTKELEKSKMSRNEPYVYFHNVTIRRCIITGIDITHQIINKRYILESTVKELYSSDCCKFEQLRKKYKHKKDSNMNINDVCREIAHRIRRQYQTLLEKKQKYANSLFPLTY